jgi:hypothetical protein
VTSSLLVGARTQCEVNNSKRQQLFEWLYWISDAIWIPARVSQCTANGSQNLNKWSTWLGKLIITMPLKSDCTQRTELEVGGKDVSALHNINYQSFLDEKCVIPWFKGDWWQSYIHKCRTIDELKFSWNFNWVKGWKWKCKQVNSRQMWIWFKCDWWK